MEENQIYKPIRNPGLMPGVFLGLILIGTLPADVDYSIGPLAAGVSLTLNLSTGTALKGTSVITATADKNNNVVESNETNNTSSATIIVL